MRSGSSSRRRHPGLLQAYLARGPERDPRVLVPRSALPLLRAAILFDGVVFRGWSLGWLAAFLFAEFFFVARLSVLGDRFATSSQYDPELHRRTSLPSQLAWLVVSAAALAGAGLALAASQAGSPAAAPLTFDPGSSQALAILGIAAYVTLLFLDALVEGLAARREQRAYASAAGLQASFFFATVVLLSVLSIPLAGLAEEVFGERGARGAFALQLVASRAFSELAVLWLPHWAPRLASWKRTRGTRGAPSRPGDEKSSRH